METYIFLWTGGEGRICKDGQNNSAEHLAALGINSVYLAD